ncbi:MAG: hypothetical protein KDA93_21060 [Planctomycetaceae bacterium]|nr:hypothetical protein [Planctomycetaceae bacterium]
MKRFAFAVLGLMAAGSTSADAGDFSLYIGSRGVGIGTNKHHVGGRHAIHDSHDHHGGGHGWGGHHPHRRPHFDAWHDTSHYDYVPGHWTIVHGCRVWVPGRYVWHQDGHIDHVYRNHVHHGH